MQKKEFALVCAHVFGDTLILRFVDQARAASRKHYVISARLIYMHFIP